MKIPSWLRGTSGIVVGALAVIVLGMAFCPEPTDPELERWRDKATVLLSERDSLAEVQAQITREVDSLKSLRASTGRIGARVGASSRKAVEAGRDLAEQADTAESLLVANLLLRRAVDSLDSGWEQAQNQVQLQLYEIADLELALQKSETGRMAALARVSELESLIESHPKSSKCRYLGFIPCPSRTTAAVVGAVVGGATVLILTP